MNSENFCDSIEKLSFRTGGDPYTKTVYVIESTYVNPEGLTHVETEQATDSDWAMKKYHRQLTRFCSFICPTLDTSLCHGDVNKTMALIKSINKELKPKGARYYISMCAMTEERTLH
jgi:hypothetical protein